MHAGDVRIYVPLTIAGLRELHEQSRLAPAPIRAHAVTDACRDLIQGDEEECEYTALMAAALDSIRLVAKADGPARRVVVAAEVDPSVVRPHGSEPTGVEVLAEISIRQCASVHVDDDAAASDIAQVRDAMAASANAQPSHDDVDLLSDYELLWFATQEIADLLA